MTKKRTVLEKIIKYLSIWTVSWFMLFLCMGSFPSEEPLAFGFWWVVFAAPVSYGAYVRGKKLYERTKAYLQDVEDIINGALDTSGEYLEVRDWPYENLYREKKGETILFMAAAEMGSLKSKTTRFRYHGPTARIKIMKGVYYRVGDLAIRTKTQNYINTEGVGVLVVTTKRLAFVSTGHGKNWSKTWAGLASWQPFTDGLLVQPNSGKPKQFVFRNAGHNPYEDPRVAVAALEIANS